MTLLPSRLAPAQQGSALVVALIFLVILSLLGATVASTNTVQERMAGNTRSRDLAFQAAEHALRDAWDQLAVIQAGDFDCTQGLLPNDPADPNAACNSYGVGHANDIGFWKDTFQWDTANHYREPEGDLSSGIGLVSDQPRYVVEKMPQVDADANGTPEQYFRVTARGYGGSSDAVVILQAMYRFE